MLLFQLTPEQAGDLDERLADVIVDVDDRYDAIAAIDTVCFEADLFKRHHDETASEQERKRFQEMGRHAKELLRLLDGGRPPRVGTGQIEWEPFRTWLVAAAAAAIVEGENPQLRPPQLGRRPKTWRDRIISMVYHVYPSGAATQTTGSHFEQTVDNVLEWMNGGVENVHDLICDALRRQPEKPVDVRLNRPMDRTFVSASPHDLEDQHTALLTALLNLGR